MSQQISVKLVAIRMMSGITIWVEEDKLERIDQVLAMPAAQRPFMIEVAGQRLQPSSIEGIYTADVMEREVRIKNGQWLCKVGAWHDRGEKCSHRVVVGERTVKVDGIEGDIKIPIYQDEHRSRGM